MKVKIATAAILAILAGCGMWYSDNEKSDEGYQGEVESNAFVLVKPVVQDECASCHNGVTHPLNLQVEANYAQDKVKAKIESNAMPPPPRKLKPEDKALLLSYFAQ